MTKYKISFDSKLTIKRKSIWMKLKVVFNKPNPSTTRASKIIAAACIRSLNQTLKIQIVT